MKFAAYMVDSFITFFHIIFCSISYNCTYGCIFCMLLFNFVQVSLMYSYCYVRSVLCILFVSFCVLFVCKCVLYCTVLYCTVLYCTVLHCTVLYCTVLYCITATECHPNCS